MQDYKKEEFEISGSYKLTVKLKLADNPKQPDLLAYITLKFSTSDDRYFINTGVTLRKNKEEFRKNNNRKYWIAYPKAKNFSFNLLDNKLKQEIETVIINQYDYQVIPIIDNNPIKNKSP